MPPETLIRQPATDPAREAFSGWIDFAALDPGQPLAPRSAAPSADAIEVVASGLRLAVRAGRARLVAVEGGVCIVAGRPFLEGATQPATNEEIGRIVSGAGSRATPLSGRFALVHVDARNRRLQMQSDRFGSFPLCYAIEGDRLAFSDRADAVPTLRAPALDLQALFNYVYFHVLPAPRTAFAGVARLEPARRLVFNGAALETTTTWTPSFAKGLPPSAEEFRALLQDAVEREIDETSVGAFLSGGTDSSTITGMLRKVTGAAPLAFSIGFEAQGYDEIEYAKIAARHFSCRHVVYYVTPGDVVSAVPELASHYDQPFGNSSALPAFYCATLAREHGVGKLLAGDGGDELFGGNVRYAKQKVFAAYEWLPQVLRSGLVEPLALNRVVRALPGVRKVGSYVAQARIPMPDRADSYNLLLRHGIANLFVPDLIEAVDAQEPSQLQRSVYATSEGAALVDRMLAFDWRFTLADNDLPKVVGTAELARIRVAFPMLDDRLVDFSQRLSPSQKVRGLTLRPWFKAALADFLPVEILRKKKHGFGLPFGPWLVTHAPLQRLARESLDGLVERGLVVPSARERLFSPELQKFPGYYGEMIWILMMIEQWLRRAAPGWRLR